MKKEKVYKIAILILAILILAEAAWIVNDIRGRESIQQESQDLAVGSELAEAFDEALANGQIEVWYQPIADSGTGETVGAEALSRWRDGEELIPPSAFIPALEETGQIAELDLNVFQTVCAFQKERSDAGDALFPISVNLSVASAARDGIAAEYAEILNASGLPADCVNIEITESMDSDKAALAKAADEFHAAGFLLEIDDFGAGYAALANLAIIPYDVLKIDKSLIDEIGTERGDALIRDLIGISNDFQMKTIAEGVETAEQAAFLRDAGCDSLQGYYYSKPLPKDEFLDYLKP